MPTNPLPRWIKSLAKKLGPVFRRERLTQTAGGDRGNSRWRPSIEALEDRTTPTLGLITSTQLVIATSYFDSAVYEFDGASGALLQTLVAPNSQSVLQGISGETVGPDGNLYFTSQFNNSIVEYNLNSHALSTFISASVLNPIATAQGDASFAPAGLTFGPDGYLYVSLNAGQSATSGGAVVRFGVSNVGGQLSYNGLTSVVATGLVQPTGLTFGTGTDQGSLYVSNSAVGTVVKVSGATGAAPSKSTFIAAGSGGLNYPSGLTWGTDGNLYVTDLGATSFQGQVLVYNSSGSFVKVFTQPSSALSAQFPSDALFLPDGHLLTADLGPTYPASLGGPGTSGGIADFNADGTFNEMLTAGAFPASSSTGVTNISPSQLVLNTEPPPPNSTVPLATGTVNSPYNQTITATGGTGNTTLTVSNVQNAIPGLNIPTSGVGNLVISGTPTATGTVTFTVVATDQIGESTVETYTLTVNPSTTSTTPTGGNSGGNPSSGPTSVPAFGISTSMATGPRGEVLVVVNQNGGLVQFDAAGAHILSTSGVQSASVAFGPAGEVLLVVYRNGGLLQFDATGAHVLGMGGVRDATLAFGPTGLVYEIVDQNGALTQVDSTGAHVLNPSGTRSATVTFGPTGEVFQLILTDGELVQVDATGVRLLGDIF